MGKAEKLSVLLRGLRKTRRESVRGMARLAGVAPSTITRWESGSTAPRLYELYALLAALGTSPEEARAVREAFRAAFGAVRRSGRLQVTEGPVVPVSLGTMTAPVSGDLLRALRLRRNVSQADLARAAGTTQASIARFERSESFPSAQTLSRITFCLGASEAETMALLRGRWGLHNGICDLVPGSDTPVWDWDITAEMAQWCVRQAGDGLDDLRFLALRSLIATRPFRNDGERARCLARVASRHARYLSDAGRLTEAEPLASEALRLCDGDRSADGWETRVYAMLVLAECSVYPVGVSLTDRRLRTIGFAVVQPPSRDQRKLFRLGLRVLEPLRALWQDRDPVAFDNPTAAWVGAHLARYAAGRGDAAGAVLLAREAVALIGAGIPHYSGDRRLRQQLLARLLVRSGEAAEALSLLAELSASSPTAPLAYRIEESLIRFAAHRSLARQSGGSKWHQTATGEEIALLTDVVRESSFAPCIREEATFLLR